MSYSTFLKKEISKSSRSLNEIANLLKSHGFKTNKAYLSKLQNGKLPPAGDKLNEALAIVLNIDPVELQVAAYREKIPEDVLKKLQQAPKTNSA